MKIAVRGGHNFQAKGASALIDETVEDRKVYKSVIDYLRKAGHIVIDVTPGNCGVNEDLIYGVNKAIEYNVDLFVSIHFDKAYDRYEGSLGTGTWIYGTGGKAEIYAKRIVDNVANGTGLKNRGVKVNPRLYELRKTPMSAVIVETCFCEATNDVRIYNEKGPDYIGRLIAEGICNSKIENNSAPSEPSTPSAPEEKPNNGGKQAFLNSTNAKAKVALDPRNNPSDNYVDLGEIYAGELVKILPEVCSKSNFLPISYWKDGLGKESGKVWVNSKQSVLSLQTNAKVVNVITELDARYEPSPNSSRMGYVTNGERLFVHKKEGNYVLATYYAGSGYKTAYFTAQYVSLD